VQFDDSKPIETSYGYKVSASIEKDGHLNFVNDTAHPILNDDRQYKDEVDIEVVVVQRYIE
jgi:uncharacterized lipoprotein YbaY